MKVMHIADIHLGLGVSSIGHLGVTRMAEIKNTFFNIVKMCEKENVKYLLLAGDLFDSANPAENILKDVALAFSQIPDTHVMIAPGNHDFAAPGGFYTRENLWSDNVHIFKGGWDYIEFPEDKVRVFGAGFTSVYQIMPLMNTELKYPKDDFLNIGVLHGELVSGAGESDYNPITKKQIRASGLDYLALGHVHLRSEIEKEGHTYYSYSGCLEGRGFDELGKKGVYIGELTKEVCEMKFVPVCKRMYLETEIDISDAYDNNEVVDIIRENIEKYGQDYINNLYKIILKGKVEDSLHINREEIIARLDVFYAKVKDRTELNVDYEKVATEQNLKGMFVRKMLLLIEEYEQKGKKSDARIYREALEAGYRAFR